MYRIFGFASIVVSLFWTSVSTAQKISKADCEFYYAEMNRYKDSIKTLDKQVRDKESEITSLEKDKRELGKRLDRLNSKEVLLSDLQYRSIGKTRWTANNLTEEQIKLLISDIKLAQGKEEWEEAYKKKMPAYCFHIEDVTKKHGVLLNVFALAELQEVLEQEKSIPWRLPVPDDFNNMSSFLKGLKCNNVFSLLATSADAPEPKWLKPGLDVFDMNIAPLSYRRNTNNEWSGKTEAGFYCLNKKDPSIAHNIYIAYLYDYDPASPIEVESKEITSEESNFGLYVRLVSKD